MIIDKKLAEVFDVEIVEEGTVITKEGAVIPPEGSNEENIDFKEVRNNMHTLLAYGREGLEFALQVAKDTENPRAIEVFSGLLKNLADTNIALMDIHEKRKRVRKEVAKTTEGSVQNVQNNNVFVGTTKDLKKFINDMKNEED